MDAKTYPLQDILRPERRYIIPTFQRDYEWTEDGQWRLLFEDLASTAERLLEVRASSDVGSSLSSKEKDVSPHFLGAVVCASLPFATGGVALRSVIDGQQRLTTVQLMVRGLVDVLAQEESSRTKSVRRMLFNPDDVVEAPEEIYKLWPRRRDRDVWPLALNDEVPDFGKDDHLYLKARRFFAESARSFAAPADPEDIVLDQDRLTALADALSGLFKLVVIDLDDNDDAQVIFEVLNGRQTPLSAIDLVKNLLFLRSELEHEDVEALYDRYWAPFDDDWWKVEVGRGHAQRGRRDVLLSVWLTAATGAEANVGHLYREARDYLDGGPPTEDILKDIHLFAQAYRDIYLPSDDDDPQVVAAYRRIAGLDITTVIPLLAWLRTLPVDVLAAADHCRAVRAVESWALRRVFVGWQTRGYGTHVARVLRESKVARQRGDDIADAVVDGLQGGVLAWPANSDVQAAFITRRYYGVVAQSRLRLLLGAIDEQMRSLDENEPATTIDYDDLQIEHIMPTKWQKHWPILDGAGRVVPDSDPSWEAASTERSRVVDGIGNLTLVTGKFNLSLTNGAWSTKKPEFASQKVLFLNHDVAAVETWDEAHIRTRAEELSAGACLVWPRPEDLMSGSDDQPDGA